MAGLKMFLPITKIDAAQRLVYGVATAEAEDRAGEICDYETTKPFYEKWSGSIAKSTDGKSLGNVRAMHGSVAAGKVTQLNFNDVAKSIEICAKVIDDAEWAKVQEGVYTGFSQGGSYVKRWKDGDLMRYTADPSEISLVDLPCLPEAAFTMVKADGAVETRHFKSVVAEPSNADIASKATELAKAAGDAAKWADHIPAARDALIKAALPVQEPLPVEVPVTPEPGAPNNDKDFEQVWKSKRSGAVFKTKAELYKHHSDIDAKVAVDTVTAPIIAQLAELNEKLGIAKKDYSDDDRKKMAESGEAKSDGSYPIKTAKDVENAVKDFNRTTGSASDKQHIIDRAKAIGATDKLPADWEGSTAKKARVVVMTKGMPTVARLAGLIDDMAWLRSAISLEEKQEGDEASTLPVDAQQAIETLTALLVTMVNEETAEVVAGQNVDALYSGIVLEEVFFTCAAGPKTALETIAKALKPGDALEKVKALVVKTGARNSKADLEKIQAIHDHAAGLGACCDEDNCDGAGDPDDAGDPSKKARGNMAKVADALEKMTAERDNLQKAIVDLIIPQMSEIAKKVDTIASQPVPVHLQGRAVTKNGIGDGGLSEDGKSLAEQMAKLSPDEQALVMLKLAQSQPKTLTL